MQPLNIKVIIGSTREGRVADKPAHWISGELAKQAGVAIEILDLRDYPLPFFDQPITPSMSKEGYEGEVYKKWRARIAEGDAFVIVTPEYNHGYPAVLKNALDWVYAEWNRKPVSFISYGSALGVRAVEQLSQVAIELQMVPVRAAIRLPLEVYLAIMKLEAPADPSLFAPVEKALAPFVENLLWWASALKAARAA